MVAKEEGTTYWLKRSANPETVLTGYRVDGRKGRYDKDAIVCVTAKPSSDLGHSDSRKSPTFAEISR